MYTDAHCKDNENKEWKQSKRSLLLAITHPFNWSASVMIPEGSHEKDVAHFFNKKLQVFKCTTICVIINPFSYILHIIMHMH